MEGAACAQRRGEGGRLCRERPWRTRARRYGSHQGRPKGAGCTDNTAEECIHPKGGIPAREPIRVSLQTTDAALGTSGFARGKRADDIDVTPHARD